MVRLICHFMRFAIIITCGTVLAWLSCNITPSGAVFAADGSSSAAAYTQAVLLEGKWIRPDGGYVLELRNIAADGTLTAAYFNPRLIRVSQAFWAMDEGLIKVFVELRDINYPGSKYSLQFDPAADRLKGFYFQAIEQQTYAVEFLHGR